MPACGRALTDHSGAAAVRCPICDVQLHPQSGFRVLGRRVGAHALCACVHAHVRCALALSAHVCIASTAVSVTARGQALGPTAGTSVRCGPGTPARTGVYEKYVWRSRRGGLARTPSELSIHIEAVPDRGTECACQAMNPRECGGSCVVHWHAQYVAAECAGMQNEHHERGLDTWTCGTHVVRVSVWMWVCV